MDKSGIYTHLSNWITVSFLVLSDISSFSPSTFLIS